MLVGVIDAELIKLLDGDSFSLIQSIWSSAICVKMISDTGKEFMIMTVHFLIFYNTHTA